MTSFFIPRESRSILDVQETKQKNKFNGTLAFISPLSARVLQRDSSNILPCRVICHTIETGICYVFDHPLLWIALPKQCPCSISLSKPLPIYSTQANNISGPARGNPSLAKSGIDCQSS